MTLNHGGAIAPRVVREGEKLGSIVWDSVPDGPNV